MPVLAGEGGTSPATTYGRSALRHVVGGMWGALARRAPLRVACRRLSTDSDVVREAALRSAALPLLTIIGAPNVGKSTLFNRLVRDETSYTSFRPRSLVSPEAGTTRDRVEASCLWNGVRFRVQDTGGILDLQLEEVAGDQVRTIERKMEAQVLRSLGESSVVLYVVDPHRGVTSVDEGLASILRRLSRHGQMQGNEPVDVILVANKLDSPSSTGYLYDFWQLGLGEPHPLSALHGTGSGEILDLVVETLEARREGGAQSAAQAAHGAATGAATDAEEAGAEEAGFASFAISASPRFSSRAAETAEAAPARHAGADAAAGEASGTRAASEEAARERRGTIWREDVGAGVEELDAEELRMLAALDEGDEGEYDEWEWGRLQDMGEIVDLGSAEMSEEHARARDMAEAEGGEAAGDTGASPFLPFDTEVKLAVIGRPNVGKSSILNHLLGEERHVTIAQQKRRTAFEDKTGFNGTACNGRNF